MKEEDTSGFVAFKQFFACISIAGSVTVLASLCACRRWRARMPPLKWILTAIGLFNLLSAINYLYYDKNDDLICRVQASMLQFFEMGSTLYAFVMAMETHVLLGILGSSLQRMRFRMDGRRTARRHALYHGCIALYGAGTVLWMNVSESYGGNGTWCWIERPLYRLYLFYIPTWLSILAILYLDVEVVRVVRRSYQMLHLSRDGQAGAEPAEGPPAKQAAMSAKMLRVFLRMVLYPLCLLLLVLPGSVVRVIQAGDFQIDGTVFRVLSVARNMCDPSFGTLNVIMWVFSDAEVLAEWRQVLGGAALSLAARCGARRQRPPTARSRIGSGSGSGTTAESSAAQTSSLSGRLSEDLLPRSGRTPYASSLPHLSEIESTPIVDANNSILEFMNNAPPSNSAEGSEGADFPDIYFD